MADIIVTAANVLKGANAQTTTGTAGETITAGDVLYYDSTSSKYLKADADTQAQAAAVGIALCGAADKQPIIIQTSGDINPGGTVTVGTVYCVSSTGGKIAPDADLTSGMFKTILGVGTTASNIAMSVKVGNVAVPA